MEQERKKEGIIKKLFISFFMCLSMFTRIPPLIKKWDEEAKDYMIIMLPLVGAIIGGLWYGIYAILSSTPLPKEIIALGMALFPFLITGFMHFDGFLDVIDASKSYRSKEEKIKILKDPHVGSFAVSYGIIVILATYVTFSCLNVDYLILIFIPIASRILSGLFLCFFDKIRTSEYAKEENKKFKTSKIIYFIVFLLGILVLAYFAVGLVSLSLIVLILMNLYCHLRSYLNFGGINGDVSGYALTVSELVSLISLIVIGVFL